MDDKPPANRYGPLLQPFQFGATRLRNRVAMAPMSRFASPGGVPGENVAAYYARRAQGGVGLIITEGTYIDHPGANGYAGVPAFHGAAEAGWARVVEAVHAGGAAMVPQLWHVGAERRTGIEPDPAVGGYGPSPVRVDDVAAVQMLDAREMAAIEASYARAARLARQLGFDGVELHGAHGYLLDQFFWHESNRRTDMFGGSLRDRARFPARIVAAVKAELASGMPLILRISQWKLPDYEAQVAHSPAELAEWLEPLVAAGVDIFHVSTRRFAQPAFADDPRTLAALVRRITGRPVIAVGGVGLVAPHVLRSEGGHDDARSATADPVAAADAIARGECDIVAVGRALLADAEWTNKLAAARIDAIERLRPEHLQELL